MSREAAPWLDGFDDFRSRELAPLIGELETARQQARNEALKRASWTLPLAALACGLVWLVAGMGRVGCEP